MSTAHFFSYDYAHMGENIASLRRAAGMTQEMLAFRLGVSSQAVSKWERQVSFPDLSLLPAMAEVFNVSIDTLFQGGHASDGTVLVDGLPWEDDDQLRVAVFEGRRLHVGEVFECPTGELVLLIRPGCETRSMPACGGTVPHDQKVPDLLLPCPPSAGGDGHDRREKNTS